MKKLYGSISINKVLQQYNEPISENINYYKLKNKKYGLEIEKKIGNDKIEKMNIKDITEDEEKINHILNMLVDKQVLPNWEDVVNEMVNKCI